MKAWRHRNTVHSPITSLLFQIFRFSVQCSVSICFSRVKGKNITILRILLQISQSKIFVLDADHIKWVRQYVVLLLSNLVDVDLDLIEIF